MNLANFAQSQECLPQALYLHIPYCQRRCSYCAFFSHDLDSAPLSLATYLELLKLDLEQTHARYLEQGYQFPRLQSIYFGGGTPSVLAPSDLAFVLNLIKNLFPLSRDCEISLELNPASNLDLKDFELLFAAGFNRLSFGLQSTQEKFCQQLGRLAGPKEFLSNLAAAKAAGFSNISVDLILGLPGQSLADLKKDLDFLLPLELPHLSLYSLIIEEGTLFGELYAEGRAPLPSPELERQMVHLVQDSLQENNYVHYEISNFAKSGYFSRHNSAYWLGQTYYGLGAGAASYVLGKRYQRPEDLLAYQEAVLAEEPPLYLESIGLEEAQKEFFIFRLRLAEGLSQAAYEKHFGSPIPQSYLAILDDFVQEGLLIKEQGRYYYSPLGLDFADEVARAFV